MSAGRNFTLVLQILEYEYAQVHLAFQNLLEELFVQFWISILDYSSIDHFVVNR